MPSAKNSSPFIVNAAKNPGCDPRVAPPAAPVATRTVRRRVVAVLCIIAVQLANVGCATTELYRFESHAAEGDHEWIATRTVRCEQPTGTCARLHLIRGAACFQLATAGKTPPKHFTCAADELERGLSLDPAAADAAHYRELLCESLRALLSSMPGPADPAAAQTRRRFTEAARAFYRLSPGSTAAAFYIASARYHELHARTAAITPATRYVVCDRLKRTLATVLSDIRAAEQTPSPAWKRFAERYDRLAFDLGLTLKRARCR